MIWADALGRAIIRDYHFASFNRFEQFGSRSFAVQQSKAGLFDVLCGSNGHAEKAKNDD
jgi:hypothetical protein